MVCICHSWGNGMLGTWDEAYDDGTGVIIVSTPQDVALRDTVKGIAMFQKMDINVGSP